MPTLEWIGKSKVINHHLDVPYRVLEEKYTYNAEKSGNMIMVTLRERSMMEMP